MAEAAAKEKELPRDAAKTAVPPVRVKKAPDEADTDGEAGEKPARGVKQKMLATALSRAIVVATLIGSVAYAATALFGARYVLVPGSNANNNFVYRLDRLTGSIQFCGQQQCTPVARAAN